MSTITFIIALTDPLTHRFPYTLYRYVWGEAVPLTADSNSLKAELLHETDEVGITNVLVRTLHCASARSYLCDREGWAVMPLCILCDSETTELLGATICKRCDTQYRLSEAAADELKQAADWLVWRFKLPVALRWQFRIHQQPTTIVGLAWAQSMVQEREDFYADIEGRNRDAVDALASPGPVMDPWHEPIMKLGRVLGRSREASLEFAEDLIARGKVRIATLEGISFEGAKPFGQFKHWERCEKRDGEQSEGK